MRKLALLVIVVIIAMALLLYSCGKKDKKKPPDNTNPGQTTSGQATPGVVNAGETPDELPDTLPEPASTLMLVGYVLRDSVNVRSSASTSSEAVGKVSRGDMLHILKSGTTAGNNGGTWYEIRYNGNKAYIHSDFLEAKEIEENAVISIGSVVNVDSVLNIRAEPNSQSQRVGRANLGYKFVVLSQGVGDGTWSKVEFADGTDGVAYIKSEYLNVVQQKVVNMLLQ
jgi:uncharacterized protein YgiM (DUF1202 family)